MTSVALLLVTAGAGLSIVATAPWMLVLTWGVLIGLGTGSMALVFAATVADQWFIKSRGLVVGILTAGSATGQLAFLPFIAVLVDDQGTPVTLHAFAAIGAELKTLYRQLESLDLAAGSAAARRLFG